MGRHGAGHRFGFLLVAAPVGGAAAPIIDRGWRRTRRRFRFANGIETRVAPRTGRVAI